MSNIFTKFFGFFGWALLIAPFSIIGGLIKANKDIAEHSNVDVFKSVSDFIFEQADNKGGSK